MTQEPLVSIGLFTFNGAKTLRRALDTLLSQTHKNFELIVSDNASTDETPHILKEYAAGDRRINYIRQKATVSAADNQLFVLHKARGKYFMWAADDDWWDPRFIETLVRGLEENPEHGVAMSSFERRYLDGTVKDRIILAGDFNLTSQSHYSVFKKMIGGAPIHVYIYGLFRRRFAVDLLRRSLPRCIREDRVIMSEAALAARFCSVEPVLYVRTISVIKPEVKFAGDPDYLKDSIGDAYRDPWAQSRYLFLLFWRPLTSPLVPWGRKLIAPFYLLPLFWRKKRHVAREVLNLLRVI